MGVITGQGTLYASVVVLSIVSLLLGNHARAGATLSKWPIETNRVVDVGHRNFIVCAFTLEQLY